MLEFTYDGTVKAITATKNCRVIYNLIGAGGGGGGSDRQSGSNGVSGEVVYGSLSLNEGETIYCAIGSGGKRGEWEFSGTRAGGIGGSSIDGFSGGTGGNSGPYGTSGSGGGGGGATVLWKTMNSSRSYIAIAAGGGGGGGGGLHSSGYVRSTSPYGYAKDQCGLTNTSTFGRGGKGQDHLGDGGGPGGGGGGLYGGQGGIVPNGDLGAMSGSTGLSVRYTQLSYALTKSPQYNLKGNSGSAGSGSTLANNGEDGYASFLVIQSDAKIRLNNDWTSPLECFTYQGGNWVSVSEIYTKKDNQFVKVYGEISPGYISITDNINSISSPAVAYPPPPQEYEYPREEGGGS